jgi:hypothetical protein
MIELGETGKLLETRGLWKGGIIWRIGGRGGERVVGRLVTKKRYQIEVDELDERVVGRSVALSSFLEASLRHQVTLFIGHSLWDSNMWRDTFSDTNAKYLIDTLKAPELVEHGKLGP